MPGNLRFVPALLVLAGVTACGSIQGPQQAVGQSGSISVSLQTVPTVRSVTISPSHAKFLNCEGGDGGANTRSANSKLGFPNGTCFVESTIVITNTGIASDIDISGSDAVPGDGMTGWSLCSTRDDSAPACDGRRRAPGPNQYEIFNFGTFGSQRGGITDTPRCDSVFGPEGSCWATEGLVVTEGLKLVGPEWSSDTSTNWTVTVTWTPVPGRQH
jgi:hypothetical protein